jgi:hypothetical protein
MKRAAWMLLMVLLCARGAAAELPVTATIQDLIAKPEAYREKIVVLRGQVDSCVMLSCNFCPKDMTTKNFERNKCLGMEFSAFGDPMPWSARRTAEAMERAFRFATVTLSAKFYPNCLTGKDPGDPDATIVCLDRAAVLYDAVVQQVHSRKNADTGIVTMYDWGKLSEPGEKDRRAMLDVLADVYPKETPKLFLVADRSDLGPGVEAAGYGCYCLADSCEGKWPQEWVGGFDNLGNAFFCVDLWKKQGVWQVL